MSDTSSPSSLCGYIAVIGAPNAGKSTFVNQVVGNKVSIVSSKVQTTRSRILGIALRGSAQIILMDTPGLFNPQSRLDRAMVSAAWSGTQEADAVLYLFDSKKKGLSHDDEKNLARLKELSESKPVYLALNKVDIAERERLFKLATDLNNLCPFVSTFMISALSGDGVEDVVAALVKNLPSSPWLFGEDQISDMPMRLLAAEVTREQVFVQLYQELPYAVTVETEKWEQFDNGDIRIQQVIHIERENQKSIILGKNGERLREIGTKARLELEKMLGSKVHLKLFVRVSQRWRDDPDYYQQWGLDYKA